jgi:hypothetical protein
MVIRLKLGAKVQIKNMEGSTSANNERLGLRTPSERDYQEIGVAGRRYRVISLSAIIFASLLPAGIIALTFLSNSAPAAPPPGVGFQVVKKPFIDVDILGLVFIFTLYASWVLLFSLLFSASKAALTATKHKLPDAYTKAKHLRSKFNKLLVVWLLVLLLIITLITVGF